MGYPFQFDKNAAIAALLYILKQVKETTSFRVVKVMYFADKLSLERYGRFIFGDQYYAMSYGPVPSKIYSFIQDAELDEAKGDRLFSEVDSITKYIRVRRSTDNKPFIQPLKEPDIEELSESDILCLDEAIKLLNDKRFDEISELSHDEAWRITPPNKRIAFVDILESVEDAELVRDYLENPNP